MSNPVKLLFPCDMSLVYLGDSWQDHRDRPGYLAQGWEPGQDIISKSQAGVDLVSVLPGKVLRDKDSGYNSGFGTYLDIDHGVQADGHRYRSLYAHMASNIEAVGQTVKAGERIGVMGTTGNSNCIHVHFILWVDGKNVDPMPYLMQSVTPPVVVPPEPVQLGERVQIGPDYSNVGVRTAPTVTVDTLIKRISTEYGYTFERLGEVSENGIMWTKVVCYIASEYLEPVK